MADDLLDELSTKAAIATPIQTDPGNSSSRAHYDYSILEDSDDAEMGIVNSLQHIVHKLESLVKEKDDLGLKQELVKDVEDMSWRIQSSMVETSKIFGRDIDKKAIIELLLDDTCDANISVSPLLLWEELEKLPWLSWFTMMPEWRENLTLEHGWGLPPNLKMLDIRSCKKLVTYLASMDLRDHCLTHLDIEHPYDNINSFPMDGCLPSSLETLYLRCFPSLEILDCKGIYHLQELLIDHCPNLQDVAGKSFPASLSILKLYGDSLLKKCWQMKDPLILSKMSHVRNINDDGLWIS
ncbi:Putative disease resistance protein [Arachis hypogaea]|nr:Putative disease resistance protein [Arachis hypogaea]